MTQPPDLGPCAPDGHHHTPDGGGGGTCGAVVKVPAKPASAPRTIAGVQGHATATQRPAAVTTGRSRGITERKT